MLWASVVELLVAVAGVLAKRNQSDLAEYVNLAAALLRESGDAATKMEAVVQQLQVMVAEGRGPTPEELEAVRAERQALSSRIQSAELGEL